MKTNKITYLSLCLVFLLVITSVQAKELSKIEFDTKVDSNVKLSGKLKHVLKTADTGHVKSIVVLKKGAILPTNEKISMKKAKNLHDIVFVNALPNDYASLFENPSVEKIITDASVKVPEADIGALTTEPDTSLDDLLTQESALKSFLSGYTGEGIKVAIIDSGIDDAAQANIIYEKDWTGEGTDDYAGHGTFMWSVVNKLASDAEYMNLKVLNENGEGTISSVLDAISVALDPDDNELTDDGADIILLSLGINPATADDPEAVAFFTEQVNDFAQTHLIIASAGNGGPFENSIYSPAVAEFVLSLGSADASLSSVAVFSSRGPVDNLIKPDFIAPGSYIKGQKPAGVDFGIPIDETHAYASGTSVSAAYGVGVAALVLEKGEAVRDVFSTYAVDLGASESAQGQGLLSLEEQVDLGEYDQVFWKVKHLRNRDDTEKLERLCIVLPPNTDVVKAEYATVFNVDPMTLIEDPYFFTTKPMVALAPVEGNNLFEVPVPINSEVFVNITFAKLESELWPDILSCDDVIKNEQGHFVKALSLQTNWSEHLIDGNFIGSYDLFAVDIEKDGDKEFVLSSYIGSSNKSIINNAITLWENKDGQGSSWNEYTIDDEINGYYHIFVDDIDQDNDDDVVGAGNFYYVGEYGTQSSNDVSWWEHDSDSLLNWDQHQIDNDSLRPFDVAVGDIIGNSNPDVICSTSYYNMSIWENTGGWPETNVLDNVSTSRYVTISDINGDNVNDLVTTLHRSLTGDLFHMNLTWWKRIGSTWSKHNIDDYVNGTFSKPDIIDVDRDGDLDVIGGFYVRIHTNSSYYYEYYVAWWENIDGNGNEWAKHIIDDTEDHSYGKFIALDFDYDGDIDLVSSANWWENVNVEEDLWTRHQYNSDWNYYHKSFDVADVNNDGFQDIIIGYGYENEIKWWENPGAVPILNVKDTHGETITDTLHVFPGDETEIVITLTSPIAFKNTPVLDPISQSKNWDINVDSLICQTPELGKCVFNVVIDVPSGSMEDNHITVTYERDDGIDITKEFDINVIGGVPKTCSYSVSPNETTYYDPALPSEESEQVLAHMHVISDSCNVPIDLDVKRLPAGWEPGTPVTVAAGASGDQFIPFNVPTDEKVGSHQEQFRIDATTSLGINHKTANLNLVVENPIPIMNNDEDAFLDQYDGDFNEASDEYFDLGRLFGFRSVTVPDKMGKEITDETTEKGYFVSPGLTYFVNEKLEKRSKPALGGGEEAVDQPAVEWGIDTSATYYTHFTALVNWLKSVEGNFRTNPPKEICFIAGTDVDNIGLKAYIAIDNEEDAETELRTSRLQIKECSSGKSNIMNIYDFSPNNYGLFGIDEFIRLDFSIDVPSSATIDKEYEAFGVIKVFLQDDTSVAMPFRVSAKVWYDYLTVTTEDIHDKAKDTSITLVEKTVGVNEVNANLVDEFAKRKNGKVVEIDDNENVPFWYNFEINIDNCENDECRSEKTVNKKLYVNMYLKNHLKDEKKPLDAKGITPYVLIIGNDNDIPYSRVEDVDLYASQDGILSDTSLESLKKYNSISVKSGIYQNVKIRDDLSYEGNTYRSDARTADLDNDNYFDVIISRLPRQFKNQEFVNEYLKAEIRKFDSSSQGGTRTINTFYQTEEFPDANTWLKDLLEDYLFDVETFNEFSNYNDVNDFIDKLSNSKINYLLTHGTPASLSVGGLELSSFDNLNSEYMPEQFRDDSFMLSLACTNAYELPLHYIKSFSDEMGKLGYDDHTLTGDGTFERLSYSLVYGLFWDQKNQKYRNLKTIMGIPAKSVVSFPKDSYVSDTDYIGNDFIYKFTENLFYSTVGETLFHTLNEFEKEASLRDKRTPWCLTKEKDKIVLRHKFVKMVNLYGDLKNGN